MLTIVTCMKNEGPFILDWVAYHMSIGFEKFLIYTNDCDDGTDTIADRLAELGVCEHHDNPRIGTQRPQAVAMRDMFRRDIVKNADWVLFSDCDEYLNIHVGAGDVEDLLEAAGDVEVISPMWRLFGDGGIVEYSDAPIIEQFFWAAPADRPVAVNAWGFKSLFRPSANVDRIGAHRPFFKDEEAVFGKWARSDGGQMAREVITQGWRYTVGNGGYDLAQLNHYAVRSVDSFLVKCDRGHVLHTHKDIDIEYHTEMSHNVAYDDSILRRMGKFNEVLNILMTDRVLADLHAEATRLHKERARALRSTQAELFETLSKKATTFRQEVAQSAQK